MVIYFVSPFSRHPMYQTLTSVGRKKPSVYLKNVPSFSSNHLSLHFNTLNAVHHCHITGNIVANTLANVNSRVSIVPIEQVVKINENEKEY